MKAEVLVKEILEIVNTLSKQDMGSLSGDTLSRLAVKLASYKASLGEYVSYAKEATWKAEADYRRGRAEEYKRLRDDGKGSTDADELKGLGAHELFVAWNKAKSNQDKLQSLSIDCHDLIDALKSRLIHLQTERGESDVY